MRPIHHRYSLLHAQQSLSRLLLIQASFFASHSPMVRLREGAVLIWFGGGRDSRRRVLYAALLEPDGYGWYMRVARHGWGLQVRES